MHHVPLTHEWWRNDPHTCAVTYWKPQQHLTFAQLPAVWPLHFLCAEEAELRRWPRLLSWELQRAVCESHLWLSLWERPPRSPFTRLQRLTCCSLLMHLCMLANAVWYGTVAYGNRWKNCHFCSPRDFSQKHLKIILPPNSCYDELRECVS